MFCKAFFQALYKYFLHLPKWVTYHLRYKSYVTCSLCRKRTIVFPSTEFRIRNQPAWIRLCARARLPRARGERLVYQCLHSEPYLCAQDNTIAAAPAPRRLPGVITVVSSMFSPLRSDSPLISFSAALICWALHVKRNTATAAAAMSLMGTLPGRVRVVRSPSVPHSRYDGAAAKRQR